MRKLILITVLMLASASAFAGDSRSLSLASNDVFAASQPTVDRAAVAKVSVKLAQAAAPIQSDAAPTLPQTTTTTTTQAPAPVQTAAPATTTQPATTTTTTADTQPAAKPAKTATKTRRESDEHKARRIAAKYGVYW
jgi:hypothetical protein